MAVSFVNTDTIVTLWCDVHNIYRCSTTVRVTLVIHVNHVTLRTTKPPIMYRMECIPPSFKIKPQHRLAISVWEGGCAQRLVSKKTTQHMSSKACKQGKVLPRSL